jgi:DNA-binding transcriptional ArsR family regulator
MVDTGAAAKQIDLESLRAAASDACGLLKVLANPDRLLLLCQLTQGEYCVSELESLTGIKQPTLSRQLTVLRQESMIRAASGGLSDIIAISRSG